MKLPGQTPDASKTCIYATANKRTLQTGMFKGELGWDRGENQFFSVSQATLTDLHEVSDMSSLGGIWAPFAVVDDTPGLDGVW